MIASVIEKYELSGTYDNVTVVGTDQADHDRRLEAFLRAAEAENLSFNDAECETNKTEIGLLGYRVSHNFIRPDPKRLEPLMNLPVPRSKGELQRAVGLCAYCTKWIVNFSSKARPLHQALKSNLLPLSAGAIKAFNELRSSLVNATLTCVRDDMPFRVDCDASEHTIAATLSQADRPVAFFSGTLSKYEVSYPAAEKDAIF